MKLLVLLFLFFTVNAFTQNCTFNYYNKKGGHYLFSTYYQSDMQTKMEGVCQQSMNGQLYEKRIFKDGHIIEEELNYADLKKRIRYKLDDNPKDSIISTLIEYSEDGKIKQNWIFYYDHSGRRCRKIMEYFPNGKLRSVKHYGWVKETELEEHSKKNYPPHTIDDDGYTYLSVPVGVEELYHDNGKLLSRVYHTFIVNDYGGDVSKSGPFVQYYDNGQLHIKGQYVNGKANGKFLNYHYTGELSEEKYFKNEVSVGAWKGWHPNGKQWYLEIYDSLASNPFQASTSKFWNDKGILIKEYSVDRNGTGKEKVWYDDGTPMLEEDLSYYQRYQGIKKEWYPNGILKRYYNKSASADTLVIEQYENGTLKILSTNRKDQHFSISSYKEWYPNGVLKNERTHDNAIGTGKITAMTYYPSGILSEYREYESNQLIEERYFPNGQKQRSTFYLDGKLSGKFQLFDSLGNVLEDMTYLNGMRHGVCRVYTPKGSILFSVEYNNGCPVLDTKESIHPPKRKLSDLKEDEQQAFYSVAREILIRELFSETSTDMISQDRLDSIAQSILWLHDEWVKNDLAIDFPFETVPSKHPEFTFTLPVSQHGNLSSGDFSHENTKRLIHVFDSLGWKFPKNWKLQGQYFVETYQNKNIYSMNFVYRTFSYWYTYGQISYSPHSQLEIDYGMKGHRMQPPSFMLNPAVNAPCVHAYSLSGYVFQSTAPIFLVYDDGTVEIYNRQKSWEELKTMEQDQHIDIGWD